MFYVERDKQLQALLDVDSHCTSLQLTISNLKQEDNHGQTVKGQIKRGTDKNMVIIVSTVYVLLECGP